MLKIEKIIFNNNLYLILIMAQQIIYNNYQILIEYFSNNEIIQIEIKDLTNSNHDLDSIYITNIESYQVNIQPLSKFYKALVNGLTNKPNYQVTITPNTKNFVSKLILDVKINYDEIIELNDSIHIPTKKSVKTDFDSKINQLEQKLEKKYEKKILELETFYKIQLENLIEKVNKLESEQVSIVSHSQIIFKNIDICDISYFEYIDQNRKILRFNIKCINNYGLDLNISDEYNFAIHPLNSHPHINNIKYLSLNIKKLVINFIEINSANRFCILNIEKFIKNYLSSRQDFVIDEIKIHNNELIDTLIKYSNYKKLLIKYDKDFNDNEIKAHCQIKNIQFDYIK